MRSCETQEASGEQTRWPGPIANPVFESKTFPPGALRVVSFERVAWVFTRDTHQIAIVFDHESDAIIGRERDRKCFVHEKAYPILPLS